MKKILFFFFLLRFCLSYSQILDNNGNKPNEDYSKGYGYKTYFALVGKVKETEVINELTIKIDSSFEVVSSKVKRIFNKNGYLLKEYRVQKDSSLFLKEENIFDAKDNLLLKSQYAKQWKRTKDSVISTNDVNSYQEKYTYNSENKLLTKYQKTNKQKDFYISQRNTYKDGKLLNKEDLNNHIETSIYGFVMCKGDGYSLNDFITKYDYNNDVLIRTETYIDTSVRYRDTIITVHLPDTILNNYKVKIPIIRKDADKDFSGFELEIEENFQHNIEGRLLSSKKIKHNSNYPLSENENFYEYWGSKELKTISKNKNGYISGRLYEYKIINKDTLLHKSWYLKGKVGDEKFEKRLISKYIYNSDGSYILNSYRDNKIDRTQLYNMKKHLIEYRDLRNNSLRQINYKYDNNGNYIEKITLQNGVIKEKITRKISYY
ncbi:hypothetical protein HNV08_03625 [Winogradskyella eckloniae]|uniref:hypothetical protein n=1 Tax=Winogradskyella eckloniae TaxID=1089306 RepID=UPI0015661EFA|nr:hypothetical protein [Winogradskyella eckloniae]NRD19126.1 hypothetical protein [Winogradskyella eckloniae]